MEGKELLKYFRDLPEHYQNKILVDAYKQIATLHQNGKSYDSFTWRDCRLLDNDELIITAYIDSYFNEESYQRNLLDYAGIIYCLTTGKKSAEPMSRDADGKIQSAVLREIVLTICGRNNSVNPLIEKLKQPYTDEDTFFENYSTVDDKEAAEAYKKQWERFGKPGESNDKRFTGHFSNQPVYEPWYTKFGHSSFWNYLLILAIFFGGIGGARSCKSFKNYHATDISSMLPMHHIQRSTYPQVSSYLLQQAVKHSADSMIFQHEKLINGLQPPAAMATLDAAIDKLRATHKNLGDKLPAESLATIDAAIDKLRAAHNEHNQEAIDAAKKELHDALQAARQDIYNAQQAAGAAGAGTDAAGAQQQGSTAPGGDTVQDVDFPTSLDYLPE